MQQVASAPRLLVWDTVHEWTRTGRVQSAPTIAAVHAAVVSDIKEDLGRFELGYTGPVTRAAFESFCRLAWVWIRARPGVLVIEELADVTTPQKAPPAWGEIVRKGRHKGGSIYALTQRPAESDKTIAGNCDIMHSGRQSFPRDRQTIAEYLDVPLIEVNALTNLQFIERDLRTGAIARGRVNFKR